MKKILATTLAFGMLAWAGSALATTYTDTFDADAEYIAQLRNLFDNHNIRWQTGMLGKVDEGGGGTVAMFLAQYGIRTIDAGAAVISMHSPMELASKFDIYEIYKAYMVFYDFQ